MEINHSEKTKPRGDSDFQVKLDSIGSTIKTAREQKSLTLESLAENLKINKSYLYAIETGDYKSLPEIIYVKAMIRRIAEKLELELDIQNTFSQESRNKIDLTQKEEDVSSKKIKKSLFLIPLFALITFFLGAFSVKTTFQWLFIPNEIPESTINNFKK